MARIIGRLATNQRGNHVVGGQRERGHGIDEIADGSQVLAGLR
jgi:hypothetical protein